MNRNITVGDMIFEKESRSTKPKWIGIVYNIKLDKYGHGKAFLKWTPEDPPQYDRQYGYACINIHNLFSQFDVIKK